MQMKPADLANKTIRSCELISAEYGRTADNYLLLTFTDGTRCHPIGVTGWEFHNPDPKHDDMAKAPNYYTAEEVAAKVLRDEQKRRGEQRMREEREQREYERLKARYEKGGR